MLSRKTRVQIYLVFRFASPTNFLWLSPLTAWCVFDFGVGFGTNILKQLASQEYFKKMEQQRAAAAAWRTRHRERKAASNPPGPTGSSAAGPSSAASGPPQAKRRRTAGKTVPKTFDLQAATPFLPCVLGCTLFESATEGRIRAFYTVGTSRRSTSASIVNYGLSQALTWCLKWAWQTHSEHTGESCPWPELLERVCEPLP